MAADAWASGLVGVARLINFIALSEGQTCWGFNYTFLTAVQGELAFSIALPERCPVQPCLETPGVRVVWFLRIRWAQSLLGLGLLGSLS